MQLQRVFALASLAISSSAAQSYSFDDIVPGEDRIYGGTDADVAAAPWTVSLKETTNGPTYCGGTVVAAQYIVTAAQCAKPGAYASIGSESIKISEQFIHPKYAEKTREFDVAVLNLEKATTAKALPLAAADGSQDQVGTMAIVRGWGTTKSKTPAAKLQEVSVKIISNDDCNKKLNNTVSGPMMCAGEGGGKGVCQGDFGSGLVANDALVGVASIGGACGEVPSVYARVTSVLDFINEKVAGGDVSTAPAPVAPAPVDPGLPAPAPAPAPGLPALPELPAIDFGSPAVDPGAPGSAAPMPSSVKPIPSSSAPAPSSVKPAPSSAAPAPSSAKPTVTPAPAASTAKPPAVTAAPPAPEVTAAPVKPAPAPALKPAPVPAKPAPKPARKPKKRSMDDETSEEEEGEGYMD